MGSFCRCDENFCLAISVADFGCPIWLNSKHVSLIDTQVNETLRKITGPIKSTPLPLLSVLANITPAEIRRKQALINLVTNANFNEKSLLYDVLKEKPPERLISRTVVWKIIDNLKNFNANTE